ncbi:hypothetical protein [Bifidobacterium thermacidophilum]|uniref:Phage protein n=1 Tax=Bifidobacterium thermacidophilum subsp. thermacidophilum TaxID=79262 RepID=A0A087E4E0_9BIFI|nr:hypothetical protein [Bifidobacterium thermacidophilum]KFJ02641.1 hypothetical protein THER5_1104 [Bifidobacterium thermacidophilum subsp. thermacidophilum]
MMEQVIVYRPDGTPDHGLTRVGAVNALIAPTTPTSQPGATSEGQSTGCTLYIRWNGNWPDIHAGDTLGVRGHRYRLRREPVQWVDANSTPKGTVITLETP